MSGACPLSAARSILRRWLKAAATTRLSTFGSAGKRGAGSASRCTTAERTLGGGVKASGGSVMAIRAVAAPLGEDRETAIGLGARLRHDALGHLALEHQRHGRPERRPCLGRQPAHQKLGAHVVGQVGHDPDGRGQMRRPVEIERVAMDHLSRPG
jgi:hypothetical protein